MTCICPSNGIVKMKKLLLLLGLLGSPAVAQETQNPTYSILYTSHVCDTYENIVSWITGEFKEEILFKGIGTAVYEDQTSYGEQDGAMQYFVNQKTESWTMIYIFEPNKVCIMASGGKFQPY